MAEKRRNNDTNSHVSLSPLLKPPNFSTALKGQSESAHVAIIKCSFFRNHEATDEKERGSRTLQKKVKSGSYELYDRDFIFVCDNDAISERVPNLSAYIR